MFRRKTTPSDQGATAVEYALIIAVLVLAVVFVVAKLGSQVFNLYSTVPHF